MSTITPASPPATPRQRRAVSLLDGDIVRQALKGSITKLGPRVQIRNPVMFVVEIGAVITTVTLVKQLAGGRALGGNDPTWYTLVIAIWLWLTVVFANLAEAFAEGRGRAQAQTLRAMRSETIARMADGTTKPASQLRRGDVVVVSAGELIPGDGTVIEGIASVDESAITASRRR
jgi:K+-transporting ATPase ATPase B chain